MAYEQKGWSAFTKNKLKKAEQDLSRQKNIYASLPTDNPYDDMTNPYEDITINERESELRDQRFKESQSNILSGLKESTDSSGIASIAQTLSEEGKISSQESSSMIGEQEGVSNKMKTEYDAYIQNKRKDGEVYSRNANLDQKATLLGITQGELASLREQESAAQQAKWDAISQIADSSKDIIT